jgi:hypothetical protein
MIGFLVFAAAAAQQTAPVPRTGPVPGWVEHGSTADHRAYIDPEAVSRDGDRVRMRGRLILAKPDETGMRILDFEQELDCAGRRWRLRVMEAKDGDGRTLRRTVLPDEEPFQPIRDGTNAVDFERRYCR